MANQEHYVFDLHLVHHSTGNNGVRDEIARKVPKGATVFITGNQSGFDGVSSSNSALCGSSPWQAATDQICADHHGGPGIRGRINLGGTFRMIPLSRLSLD